MAALTAQTQVMECMSAQSESSGISMAQLERGLALKYQQELLQAIQLSLSVGEKIISV